MLAAAGLNQPIGRVIGVVAVGSDHLVGEKDHLQCGVGLVGEVVDGVLT
jgi:hypothetical protein